MPCCMQFSDKHILALKIGNFHFAEVLKVLNNAPQRQLR